MRHLVRVVFVGSLLMSAACGTEDTPAEQMTPPTLPPATTSPEPSPAGEAIDFGDEGVFVESADDAAKLSGTPEDFRQFIAGIIDEARTSHGDDKECSPNVGVVTFDPSGFAAGSRNDCGGYAIIWAKKDGIWQQVIGGQDLWPCDELKDHGVPASVAGDECYDGTNAVPYPG